MYNEALGIGAHLEKLSKIFKENYSLLIIDDGSQDGSASILEKFSKKMRMDVIRHPFNQGLCAAMNSLLYEAANRLEEDDILITMDADATHDPKYVEQILDAIQEGYNFVALSRFRKGSKQIGYPLYKMFLSRCINFVLKGCFPVSSLRDYTTGYRGFKGTLIKKLVSKYGKDIVTAKGFAGMTEILLKLREFNLKAKEIPLVYRYDLKQGLSKLPLTTTIKEYFKLIIKGKFL